MTEKILFYLREEPYGFLSNFWRAEQCIIDSEGGWWCYPTNEHFYQSMKAKNQQMSEWIAKSPTAYAAMCAGRSLRSHEIVDDWDIEKVKVMLIGLRMKFMCPYKNMNSDIRKQLIDTGDAILIEDSPTDMFWGGSLPNSKNMLGELLMQVRNELNEE